MNGVTEPMRCKKVKRKLYAYLDNELNESQKAKIQQHLCHCSDCASEVQLLTRTLSNLKIWRDIEPSDNFSAIFWGKVAAQEAIQPLHPSFLERLVHIPFTVAIATVLIIGLFLGGIIGNYLMPQNGEAKVKREYVASFALDSFKALPPDSIGSVYFALAKRPK